MAASGSLTIVLVVTIVALRSRHKDGFRWVPLRNPGTPVVVDAYLGRPILAMDRVTILVKSVDRTHDSFNAEVNIVNQPNMDISGGIGSRFRDEGSTVEIQAADLVDQASVRFKLWRMSQ
jgi:hypothetical protein